MRWDRTWIWRVRFDRIRKFVTLAIVRMEVGEGCLFVAQAFLSPACPPS